jgi:hypothetical protein
MLAYNFNAHYGYNWRVSIPRPLRYTLEKELCLATTESVAKVGISPFKYVDTT